MLIKQGVFTWKRRITSCSQEAIKQKAILTKTDMLKKNVLSVVIPKHIEILGGLSLHLLVSQDSVVTNGIVRDVYIPEKKNNILTVG